MCPKIGSALHRHGGWRCTSGRLGIAQTWAEVLHKHGAQQCKSIGVCQTYNLKGFADLGIAQAAHTCVQNPYLENGLRIQGQQSYGSILVEQTVPETFHLGDLF